MFCRKRKCKQRGKLILSDVQNDGAWWYVLYTFVFMSRYVSAFLYTDALARTRNVNVS